MTSIRKLESGRLIAVALLLVFAIVIPQIPHAKAGSGIVLDGNGFGSAIGSSCAWSQTLTTTNSPDVIIVMIVINDTTTTVSSPTDTASLSWTPTPRASQKGPTNVQIFYYYAIASMPLFADSISFGLSSGKVASVCQSFGIFGADTNFPFDPNAGLPNKGSGASTTASLTYSTSNPNDFLIILEGFCALGSAGSGNPQGFTVIGNSQNAHVQSSNCAANFLQTNTYYRIVSSTQSSSMVSWDFDSQVSSFAIVADAIQSIPGSLSASVTASSNVADVGQPVSFSCNGAGGISPYTYSWTFGDGGQGSGASTSHTYNTPGTINVTCSVTDLLGTSASDGSQLIVTADPSIASFTASPTSLDLGGKVAFVVSTSGGYGGLSYSYANLPAGCLSINATTLSCTPTSSGNYAVRVTVTDHQGESATATVNIGVGPQRVLGLPAAMGWAVIFGTTLGIAALAIVSALLVFRGRRRRTQIAT